ncbi:hypothetical protein SAY86_008784 [Trapa natans]|uniref:Agmatine coumaroyltransferase-2-like n=1 Tax=Trapa natans TaxID=22666 RepID=A0AAN7KA33_TRANT|nr:hypothetical protein SAY86_008784 [Trapa natans]
MKVKIESSTIVKPAYDLSPHVPSAPYIPLSVFDKVAYDSHIGVIYAYRPPAVSTTTLKLGLLRVLAVYREWAGRIGKNHRGDSVVILNDQGVRFVEASVDSRLDQTLTLLKPSPALLNLHPPLKGIDELVQVQATRFACGSVVIGFTAHHSVADGQATSNFLVAWGRACRGLDIGPLPIRDRSSFFIPRDPAVVEFDHFTTEYTSRKIYEEDMARLSLIDLDNIVTHRAHFSVDFLMKLKARAASADERRSRSYSTFVCLVAHLWRAITRARSLSSDDTTQLRLSVNGRSRMNSPRVPNQYFGNLVLWAVPKARVKDLLREPLPYAARLINDAIARVDGGYFQSFIDFAATKLGTDEVAANVIPTAFAETPVLCPDVEVDSWLRMPFYDLDFGSGSPYVFMPTYVPIEGGIYVLPSYVGDGSIDVFAPLFKDQLAAFCQNCYILE